MGAFSQPEACGSSFDFSLFSLTRGVVVCSTLVYKKLCGKLTFPSEKIQSGQQHADPLFSFLFDSGRCFVLFSEIQGALRKVAFPSEKILNGRRRHRRSICADQVLM